MPWWDRLLGRQQSLDGSSYRIAFSLYSEDAAREVEVREFSNGETYLVERERGADGQYVDRHSGRMVGPFASPGQAEAFIAGTPWFTGSAA